MCGQALKSQSLLSKIFLPTPENLAGKPQNCLPHLRSLHRRIVCKFGKIRSSNPEDYEVTNSWQDGTDEQTDGQQTDARTLSARLGKRHEMDVSHEFIYLLIKYDNTRGVATGWTGWTRPPHFFPRVFLGLSRCGAY